MKLLKIRFVKVVMDELRKAAMKLLVSTLSEIASEIAGEIAVKLCTLVFIKDMNFTAISLAIPLAISLGGLPATSRQISLAISLAFLPNTL